MDGEVVEAGEVAREFERASGAHGVADEALGVVDRGVGAIGENAAEGFAFLDVAEWRGGGVGVDEMDFARGEAGAGDGGADALGLARGVGEDVVGGVGVDVVTSDLAVDFRAAGEGGFEAFEGVERAAFGDDDTVAIAIEGTAGFFRVGVGGEGVLRFETGEDAEGVDAFADAAADRKIDFAEAEHLRGVDEAEVAGGAGGADGVGGAGDAEVEGSFAGGVVGDGAGVVIVRPVFRVVVKFRYAVDLVFRFDISVLGAADVDADAVFGEGVEVYAAVGEGFARAINRDGACAGADADLFFLLIF